MKQMSLFEDTEEYEGARRYKSVLTVSLNGKGVLDVDTVKGCQMGLVAYPNGGCYGECYACKTAKRYGIDFATSVSRKLYPSTKADIFFSVKKHYATWYRIGTAGDPSHDWDNTISVCEYLQNTGKTPVIITKHWKELSDFQLMRLKAVSAVINTSTSGMDTDIEIKHRIGQIKRLSEYGIHSVNRVVTCEYGLSDWAKQARDKQDYLLGFESVIDNPLRASKNNINVMNGNILLTKKKESVGGGKYVSLHNKDVYLGTCQECPDQCGVQN